MSAMSEPMLPFDEERRAAVLDGSSTRARRSPSIPQNVVLEASAGTGKTRVLVERYVNLLRAGVDPDHILAITFTRKAAAEMRQRIIERLKEASRHVGVRRARAGATSRSVSATSRSRRSTPSACRCCASFRSRPTSIRGSSWRTTPKSPRLIGESLDQALRICRGVARDDDDVALVFAQLGERRLRAGLAALLDRRLVAPARAAPISCRRVRAT